jgi:hypothetical protein
MQTHEVSTASLPREDCVWAASVFTEQGRFGAVGGVLQLMVNSKSKPEMIHRLAAFGGKVYEFGGLVRWQIADDGLVGFLTTIKPFLTDHGLEKARAVLGAVDAFRRAKEACAKTPSQVVLTAASPEQKRVDAFSLVDGVDEDQLGVLLTVPKEALPVTPEGEVVLRALTGEHAAQWTLAMKRLGFAVRVSGLLIFVKKEPTE